MNCDFNIHNNFNFYKLELFLGSIQADECKKREVKIIQGKTFQRQKKGIKSIQMNASDWELIFQDHKEEDNRGKDKNLWLL